MPYEGKTGYATQNIFNWKKGKRKLWLLLNSEVEEVKEVQMRRKIIAPYKTFWEVNTTEVKADFKKDIISMKNKYQVTEFPWDFNGGLV